MKETKSKTEPTPVKTARKQQKVLARLHRVDQLIQELDRALKVLEREPLDEQDVLFIASEINTLAKGRDTLASELKTDIYRKYKTILLRHRETAVVNVVNHTCQGCHVQLPTGFLTKLQFQDQIHFCPNCGRILVPEG